MTECPFNQEAEPFNVIMVIVMAKSGSDGFTLADVGVVTATASLQGTP